MWLPKTVKVGSNDLDCSINIKNNIVEIELPFVEDWAKLLESDGIMLDGSKLKILSTTNVAGRNEKIFITCTKEKNKKTERGTNEQSTKSRKNN
jgi:hypothetical protein|tara:strand:+ start:1119 stop:1400 length:282 start_codon:yes stop_codon:yes gene_type:complete